MPTETLKFTESKIAKLPIPAEGRVCYADTETRGLRVVVSAAGNRAFEYYRRIGGRPRRLALGRWPELTLTGARKAVATMAGEIAQGRNPAQERRRVRRETTLAELFDAYLEGYAKPHKRTWPEDVAQFKRYLAPWKARKVSDVQTRDVVGLHARIGRKSGHYAANRLLALLSGMFTHAARLGLANHHPARGVRRFREESRDRFLSADELRAFFAALHHEETPAIWRDFFTVALLTGARRKNVMAMQWADLALDRGLWRIPGEQSKNAEPMIVILAPAAVEILRRRADENALLPVDKQSHFVFPGVGQSGHVSDPTKPWKAVLKRAGIADLRVHDLRRTLGSWQAAGGASLSIIGKTLGHRDVSTTAVYARLDLDPVRASVETAVRGMLEAAASENPKG